jgi:PKD repeat protein
MARLLSAFLVFTSLLAAPVDAQPAKPLQERIRPAFPQINLIERQSTGKAAIDRLGSKLPDIASWYGKSADGLRRQLLSDRRVRLDSKGRMFVVEEMQAPLPGATAETQQAVMNGALLPLDQTFKLHSRPGSQRTIYLNFIGATITSTVWNSSSGTINAKPYDIDGVPTSFSTTELQRIQYIWQRVAEDYAVFDVDVTTEEPTAERLTRSDSSDQTFGTTVVITDNNGVYNCSCGGVAYIGVFNSTSSFFKPAFVFYNLLGNGDEKAVAEAISHEVGHNVGLLHDGSSTSSYYGGHGIDAATAWAPIMGVGYYKTVVQFSRGEYADANNTEDDFAVAASYGLPLRTDDYGNSIYAATPLPGSNGGTIDGVIEQQGDEDIVSFAADAGSFTAAVRPANRSGNADLVLTLINSAGVPLVSSNRINALDASLYYQLTSPGTYYIKVSATGEGDPAINGYSAYGSVGNYRLSAKSQGGGTPPTPVLTVRSTSTVAPAVVTFDGSQSTAADGTVEFYYWDFGDYTGDSSGTLKTASKTYTVAGTYTVSLTVVDNKGNSSTTSQTISIADSVPIKTVSVSDINLSLVVNGRGLAKAKAKVTVADQLGRVKGRAVVYATWSGVVSRSAARRANRYGVVNLLSPAMATSGCYTLTITGISLPGHAVDQRALPTKEICR